MSKQDNSTSLSSMIFVIRYRYQTFKRAERVTEPIFESWCCSLDTVVYPDMIGKMKCKLMPTEKNAISLAGTLLYVIQDESSGKYTPLMSLRESCLHSTCKTVKKGKKNNPH